MVSKKIRNLIIGIGLLYMLIFGNFVAKAAGLNGQYILPQSSITYVQKVEKVDKVQCVKSVQTIGKTTITYNKSVVQNKGKILIYSTHTNEHNKGNTITQMAENLSQKLRNEGYEVDHNTDNFVGKTDYNNAYYNSRKMLTTKGDLSKYDLIIDLHTDSSSEPISTTINNQSVAKLMFPTVDKNPNLQQQKKLIDGIERNLDHYSNNIVRPETTKYHVGITYYNSDKSSKFVLIELGGDKNDINSCDRSNTILAASINTYLSNK